MKTKVYISDVAFYPLMSVLSPPSLPFEVAFSILCLLYELVFLRTFSLFLLSLFIIVTLFTRSAGIKHFVVKICSKEQTFLLSVPVLKLRVINQVLELQVWYELASYLRLRRRRVLDRCVSL